MIGFALYPSAEKEKQEAEERIFRPTGKLSEGGGRGTASRICHGPLGVKSTVKDGKGRVFLHRVGSETVVEGM